MTSDSGKIQVPRDKGGKFLRGVSGNPGGKPKGRHDALIEIDREIAAFQKREGISFWRAVTRLAYKLAVERGRTELLRTLLDKYLPSKYDVEASSRPVTVMPSLKLSDGSEAVFEVGDGKPLLETEGKDEL